MSKTFVMPPKKAKAKPKEHGDEREEVEVGLARKVTNKLHITKKERKPRDSEGFVPKEGYGSPQRGEKRRSPRVDASSAEDKGKGKPAVGTVCAV